MTVDISVVLDAALRQAKVVRANWKAAMASAREFDADGFAASGELGSPGGGGDGSSVVERAALSRTSNAAVRELEAAAKSFDCAAAHLQSTVLKYSVPRARNLPDGRVATDCGNPYGCPTDGRARKRGLCEGCWNFEDGHGRHRTLEDVAESRERERLAGVARSAARREAARS